MERNKGSKRKNEKKWKKTEEWKSGITGKKEEWKEKNRSNEKTSGMRKEEWEESDIPD